MKKEKAAPISLDEVKKLVVIAMFSDDELMNLLVLKGGNAINLIHKLTTRASIDVDFSLPGDLPGGVGTALPKIERALDETFRIHGLRVFDVKAQERPFPVSEDVANFWGGYNVEFKIATEDSFQTHSSDIASLRRNAITLGRGTKFLIDISRFEYTALKEKHEVDGYTIFAYSPAMIICEKLRAICQQMPDYNEVIHRERNGSPRARDFVDIYGLCEQQAVDLTTAPNRHLLQAIFNAKRVPMSLLEKVGEFRDFHRNEFESVRATMKQGERIEEFDFYFDYVLKLIERLKPLGNV